MFQKLLHLKLMLASALLLIVLAACASAETSNEIPVPADAPARTNPAKTKPWTKYAQVLPAVVASAQQVERERPA